MLQAPWCNLEHTYTHLTVWYPKIWKILQTVYEFFSFMMCGDFYFIEYIVHGNCHFPQVDLWIMHGSLKTSKVTTVTGQIIVSILIAVLEFKMWWSFSSVGKYNLRTRFHKECIGISPPTWRRETPYPLLSANITLGFGQNALILTRQDVWGQNLEKIVLVTCKYFRNSSQ